jgi:hypothetical protein
MYTKKLIENNYVLSFAKNSDIKKNSKLFQSSYL